MKEFIKKNWKNILLILLAFLFVSNCTGKNNYKRKYNKECAYVEYAIDSLNKVYSDAAHHIDSLDTVIKFKELENRNLQKEVEIYKKQANRSINVVTVIDSTGVHTQRK